MRWIWKHLELITWLGALAWLVVGVDYHQQAAGFCPLRAVGLEALTGLKHCPGCGLGRSMAAALHGRFALSWHHHWFGIPAILIIGSRIVTLSINQPQKTPTT